MDPKVREVMKREKIKRPVLAYRMVGSRVELHLLGDKGYTSFPIEAKEKEQTEVFYTTKNLTKKTVKELKEIAKGLDIPITKNKNKASLIASIMFEKNGN